jgi:hypothetical protein
MNAPAGSDAYFFLCLTTYCAARMDARDVQKIVSDFDLPSDDAVRRLLQQSGIKSTHSMLPILVNRYSNALSWFRGELMAQEEILRAQANFASTTAAPGAGLHPDAAVPVVLAPSSGTRLKAGQASGSNPIG